METQDKKRDYFLPLSILISALMISGALIYNVGSKNIQPNLPSPNNGAGQSAQLPRVSIDNIKPISSQDHILGNPAAPVKLIEFSDLECPFCKKFHQTMQKIMADYGASGKVAWVYRHFPIDQLHPKARTEAEATECADELGGNEEFWAYVDKLFAITPSNNGLDLAKLPQIAKDIGLDQAKFESCLESKRYSQRVADDVSDADNVGVMGTPYTIVIAPNGQKYPINGALPYEEVKQIMEQALR